MLGNVDTILHYIVPFLLDALGRRVRARVRPLLGRAPRRRAGRGVLDRLRARAVRPQRPPRHALEVQRRPAWAASSRCWATRMRPAPPSTPRPRHGARTASPPRRWPSALAIVAAGPVMNFLFAIVVLAILFAHQRPAVNAGRGRAGPARQPRGQPPACCRATGSWRSTAAPSRASRISRRRARQRRPPLTFTVQRDGKPVDLTVTPAMSDIVDRFGTHHQIGLHRRQPGRRRVPAQLAGRRRCSTRPARPGT